MNGVALGTGLTINAYTGDTPQTGDSFARIGAAGAGLTAITGVTLATSQPGVTIPTVTTVGSVTGSVGSVTGAVGSVTGAVGSVTGNVGGNVVGSTASVTGAVGSVTGNVGGNVVGSVGSVTGAVGSVTAAVSTTSNVKKNSIVNGFMFTMTDSTTHLPKTGLGAGITAQLYQDGSFIGATTNTPSEISNGWYTINLAAADTNANKVGLRFTATGADALNIEIITQP